MDNIRESLGRALNVVFKQRKLRHVVEWADKYFQLPADSSNNQADIRWKTYGYQRFILHAFTDLDSEIVAVIKSVQMGLSKCALVCIGFESAHRMRSNGIWLPSRTDRDEFAGVQIQSMLEHCPEVGNELRVAPGKKDPDNTKARRAYKGAQSYCRGTQTLQDVSSIPVMTAFMDELSKMLRMIKEAKDDLGKSPVDGVRGRLASAEAPKLNMLSTPTEFGVCEITKQYLACKVKFHRHYCCPECNDWQPFDWGDEKTVHGFKWDRQFDDQGQLDTHKTAKTVYYQCRNCPHKFYNKDLKTLDNERAEWRSMLFNDETQEWTAGNIRFDEKLYQYRLIDSDEIIESPYSVGIQVRGWMSRRKKWWQICLQFLEAVQDNREGRPGKLADWQQDCKGECYAPPQSAEYIRHGYLMKKQEDEPEWTFGRIPDDIQCITAWWDVQVDRIEGLVVGWGFGEECWLIEHVVKWGDADATNVLESVRDLTKKTYKKENGFDMPIFMSGIDARYKTDSVNDICSGEWKHKIIPTYGDRNVGKPLIVGQTKTRKKRDTHGITVCTNSGKETVYSRYKIETPGSAFIHIPAKDCFDEAFIKQMCAEKRGLKAADPMRWQCPDNVSNEATDLMVGNLAIITLAQQKFRLRLVPRHEYQDEPQETGMKNSLKDLAAFWAN